eukprot:3105279-Amphidinium_carterae.1
MSANDVPGYQLDRIAGNWGDRPLLSLAASADSTHRDRRCAQILTAAEAWAMRHARRVQMQNASQKSCHPHEWQSFPTSKPS